MAEAEEPLKHIPFYRTLQGKLTYLLVGALATTAITLTAVDYAYVRHVVVDDIHNELELHRTAIQRVLELFVQGQHERVALVANQVDFVGTVAEAQQQEPGGETSVEETAARLNAVLSTADGFLEIRIADAGGTVVAASDIEQVGSNVGDLSAFHEAKQGPQFDLMAAESGESNVVLSAPIQTRAGTEVAGVALVDLDPSLLGIALNSVHEKHVTNRVRLGMTGVDGSIQYFTTSDSEGVNSANAADDLAMLRGLEGETGFLDDWEDMRGQTVIAAYGPVFAGQWAVVTQLDVQEAYAPIRQTLQVVIAVAGAYIILSVLVFAFVARRFLRPITRLAVATRRIASGDTDVRVKVRTRDEVGQLSAAFNRMSKTVQDHRASLEKAVIERTGQLEQSTKQLALLVRALESQADLMERDLRRAEIIQKSLLPVEPPRLDGFCVSGLYIPGHSVGGDLYDVREIDEDHCVVLVADAAGHGVSAAMLSALFQHRLRAIEDVETMLDPTKVFEIVNQQLIEDVPAPGVFVTAMYSVLNKSTRQLTVSSAGHPSFLLVREDGTTEQVGAMGPALGLYEDAEFGCQNLELLTGDKILFFTDGLFDARSRSHQGFNSIASILRNESDGEQVLDQIIAGVGADNGIFDRDDLTMLLLNGVDGENSFEHRDTLQPDSRRVSGNDHDTISALSFAEEHTSTFLFLHGRVTWIHGQAMFDAATSVIDENRSLIVDLDECSYLDSAALGAMHEIIDLAEAKESDVKLQNVSTRLRHSFRELGMLSVLDRIDERPTEPPKQRNELEIESVDQQAQELRLLNAHEVLSSLNEHNREEFEFVVKGLREEYVSRRRPSSGSTVVGA